MKPPRHKPETVDVAREKRSRRNSLRRSFSSLRRFGFFLFLSWPFLAALCVRYSLYFGLDPWRTLQLTVYTQAYRDHGENNCGDVKSRREMFPRGNSVSWLFRLTRFPTVSRFRLRRVHRFYESRGHTARAA